LVSVAYRFVFLVVSVLEVSVISYMNYQIVGTHGFKKN